MPAAEIRPGPAQAAVRRHRPDAAPAHPGANALIPNHAPQEMRTSTEVSPTSAYIPHLFRHGELFEPRIFAVTAESELGGVVFAVTYASATAIRGEATLLNSSKSCFQIRFNFSQRIIGNQ